MFVFVFCLCAVLLFNVFPPWFKRTILFQKMWFLTVFENNNGKNCLKPHNKGLEENEAAHGYKTCCCFVKMFYSLFCRNRPLFYLLLFPITGPGINWSGSTTTTQHTISSRLCFLTIIVLTIFIKTGPKTSC